MRCVTNSSQEQGKITGTPVCFLFESRSRVLFRCGPLTVPMLQLGCIYNGTSVVTVTRMSQRSVALRDQLLKQLQK